MLQLRRRAQLLPPITLGHAPGMQPCNGKSCVDSNMHSVQVNQRYWLQLRRGIELQGRHYTFDMCLVPQYLPKEENVQEMGVLEHLIYAAYRGQGKCIDEPPVTHQVARDPVQVPMATQVHAASARVQIYTPAGMPSCYCCTLVLARKHQELIRSKLTQPVLWLYCGATSSFSCAVSHQVIYL